MRSHRDDISADPNMDSHPYDNFLDALAEFISKNQSKYDELLQQSQENYQTNFQLFDPVRHQPVGNFEKTENTSFRFVFVVSTASLHAFLAETSKDFVEKALLAC